MPKTLHFKGDGWNEIGHSEPLYPDASVQKTWTKDQYETVMSNSFHWYSLTQDDKSAFPLALQALSIGNDRNTLAASLKKNKIELTRTISWLIRMSHLGFVLRYNERKFLCKGIRKAMKAVVKAEMVEAPLADVTAKPNIQDRIDAKLKLAFGHIEELFDEAVVNNFKTKRSVMDVLHDPSIAPPGNRVKDLIKKSNPYLQELILAASGKNEDLSEAYASYGKRGLNNMIAWWEQAINDLNSFGLVKKNARKPKKRKSVSPEKVVSKLNYVKAFPALKLNSIDPTQILRSNMLWVYNTRTRKLGLFIADKRSSSLDVKNTKILNIDPVASVQKTLRKPEKQLPQFAALGKPAALKWFEAIKATEIKMKPSISKDSVLLKAFK